VGKYKKKTQVDVEGKSGGTSLIKHGLYERLDLSGIDQRTIVGRVVKTLKKQLREYVGDGNAATEILIQRIAYKTLRCSRYEVNNLGSKQDVESDHYLPMSNSLRLDLQALAQLVGRVKGPDIEDYINKEYGEKKE